MDGNPPELDGGFFIASFPFKPEFWTVWILGAMLFSIGFFLNPTFAFWTLCCSLRRLTLSNKNLSR